MKHCAIIIPARNQLPKSGPAAHISCRQQLSYFGFRFHRAAESFHTFAKLLTLLGRHLFPSLPHPAPPMRTPSPMAMEPAEKNFAQDDKSQSLPKADLPKSKNGRHQPVPQGHNHKAKHNHGHDCEQRNLYPSSYSSCYQIPFHPSPHNSLISAYMFWSRRRK